MSKRRQRSARCKRFLNLEALETRQVLSTLVWSSGPSLPAPRTEAAAVVTPDGAIRVVGGSAAQPTAAPLLAKNATSWTQGQKTDTTRIDLGAVASGSAVYLFGGTANQEGINEVLAYDYRLGDSQDLAKMSRVRYDFGFAVDSKGRAYAIGGIGVRQDGQIWADAERFDPASGSWSAIAPLPKALHGMSAISDGKGHVFVFGGSASFDNAGVQDTVYRYNIATNDWTTMAPMPQGTRDSGVAMDHRGWIYVTGGVTKSGPTAAVQVYDPSTNAWKTETDLPQPVYGHSAVFGPTGQILTIGGTNSAGQTIANTYHTQRLNQNETKPTITTSPVTKGSLDRPYRYDVDATANPAAEFSLVTAPSGMVIDAKTGVITWQPVESQLGNQAVTVRASNYIGYQDQSFTVQVVRDTIAPTIPANVQAASRTETEISLSWDPSSDANGVDHYEVFTVTRAGNRFHRSWRYTSIGTTRQTSFTHTGLTPYTYLRYAVQAIDAAGNRSGYSTHLVTSTLAKPTLGFRYGNQTSGTIQSPAKHTLSFQLTSRANPAATFSLVSGPATMTVDAKTGAVSWTPGVADLGRHSVTFRAENAAGATDLALVVEVTPDVPQLSVELNPKTGELFATAGKPFEAVVSDGSKTPSSFELVAAPAGMAINATTGVISWTPTGDQGGTQSVTVRGTNSAGSTDLTFQVPTLFTSSVSKVTVTGTTLLFPTIHWTPPVGEGANLVDHYVVEAVTKWKVGRAWRSHRVSATVPATESAADLKGMLAGKQYSVSITPFDAAGNRGLTHVGTKVVSNPALPLVYSKVEGFIGGGTTPGPVIANEPAKITLTDQRPDPSQIELVSGPAGLQFDPATKIATWTPTPSDVTPGYTATNVRFRATNNVGSVDVVVPVRVFFASQVLNAKATRLDRTAEITWDLPASVAKPIAKFRITRYWTFHGSHHASSTIEVPGTARSVTVPLVPSGAVRHRGVSIVAIDADNNMGVDTGLIPYGAPPNNHAPTANNDSYSAKEDNVLSIPPASGVIANDTDPDNRPGYNPLKSYLRVPPAHGKLTLALNGAFTYVPDANFNGTDQFTYFVHDGRYSSNIATVTINVAPVNDAPVALDDNFVTKQDTPLVLNASQGVLANDSDVDGDSLIAALITPPTHGSLSLNQDGSLTYTPAAGFSGKDSFAYQARDAVLSSRTATVNLTVNPSNAGTKFFVPDFTARGTYEYRADGSLAEAYALNAKNRKPRGAATTPDGKTVWVIDKSGTVFVYDDAGTTLGSWRAQGLDAPEGIATDGTHIWIVDRGQSEVHYYANAATLRSGQANSTSKFVLHDKNNKPYGITTDGKSLWVVNNRAAVDQVFKYDLTGNLLGRWTIDATNSSPTGITIDPNNVQHVWIIDSSSDRIYQYDNAAARTSGSLTASGSFSLASGNGNPQGVADPRNVVPRFHSDNRATDSAAFRGSAQWANPVIAEDANDDDLVSPADVLAVVDYLDRYGATSVESFLATVPYVDTNADGMVTPADALTVISALQRESAEGEATLNGAFSKGGHLAEQSSTSDLLSVDELPLVARPISTGAPAGQESTGSENWLSDSEYADAVDVALARLTGEDDDTGLPWDWA